MNRLLKELKEIEKNKEKDLSLRPISDSDMYAWVAKFEGPPETPYEKGVFEIKLSITNEYPIRPPKAEFITKVFHPNVHFKVLFYSKISFRNHIFIIQNRLGKSV